MTHDQIDRIVRRANPVPDLTMLEPVDASVLVLDQQRRTEMQTNDRVVVDQGPHRPMRGALIGIAAVAAIVIGALILFQPRDSAPAATPIEVATAFVEALASYDGDLAASMLAADADLGEFGMLFGSLDGLRLRLRFDEANGLKTILESCEERGVSAPGTEVRCAYDYHAIRSDEIGLGPFRGSYYDFIIRDGEVVSVSGAFFTQNGFSRQVWGPFADWVAETYPDDVLVMYTNGSQTMGQITEESIALWDLRTREYVEYVRNSG